MQQSPAQFVTSLSLYSILMNHPLYERNITSLIAGYLPLSPKYDNFLHQAVSKSDVLRIERYLEAGYDPNAQSTKGETPIMLAVKSGNKAAFRLLFNTPGVALHLWDDKGYTVLLRAIQYNNVTAFYDLLKSNVVCQDLYAPYRRILALHSALYLGRYAFANELLRRKAEPNTRNVKGETPLMLAVKGGNKMIFQRLYHTPGVAYHLRDQEGNSTLQWAIRYNNNTAFRMLLQADSVLRDLPLANLMNQTALHTAIYYENETFVQGLLRVKANPSLQLHLQNYFTPLESVCMGKSENTPILRCLLAYSRDKNYQSALLKAVHSNFRSLVVVLLQAKADPNGVFIDGPHMGKSILHVTAQRSNFTIMQPLLQYKANPNVLDDIEQTPLHSAILCEPYRRPPRVGPQKFMIYCISMLTEHKANLNARDTKGRTALFYACERNLQSVVQKLLELKANPCIGDKKGTFPLHMTVQHVGSEPCIRALVEHKANLNAHNDQGQTPLCVALLSHNFDGATELLKLNAKFDISGMRRKRT